MTLNDTFRYLSAGLPDDILRKKLYGDFDGAIRLIDRRLSDPDLPLPSDAASRLSGEICLRLPGNYPPHARTPLQSSENTFPIFRKQNLTNMWMQEKSAGFISMDKCISSTAFFQTLCKASLRLPFRAGVVLPGAESAGTNSLDSALLNESMRTMKEKARAAGGSGSGLLKLKDSVFPKECLCGHTSPSRRMRTAVPNPIEKVFPENGKISPGHAPQRTICWEETMMETMNFMWSIPISTPRSITTRKNRSFFLL